MVLRLACESIWAAPRKPTSIRPPPIQKLNISTTETSSSAVAARSSSPIESGSRTGCAPIAPDS